MKFGLLGRWCSGFGQLTVVFLARLELQRSARASQIINCSSKEIISNQLPNSWHIS